VLTIGLDIGLWNLKTDFEYHLRNRGLKPWHKCWHTGSLPDNTREEHVIFPLIAPGGRFIGHQRYFWRRPKLRSNDEQGKYITTYLKEAKLTGIYGWDNCFGCGPLFVTEGIWDSIRVNNCYLDCVALLCNSPSKQMKQYIRMIANGRPIVALIDRDENKAGERLGRAFDYSFEPAHGYGDYNDMPHSVCFEHMTNILNSLRRQ
jgi:hypothetical protein